MTEPCPLCDAPAEVFTAFGGLKCFACPCVPVKRPTLIDPRLVETRRLRDKLKAIYAEIPPLADVDQRAEAVLAEIRAVWA